MATTNPNNPSPPLNTYDFWVWVEANILAIKRRVNGISGGGGSGSTNIYNSDGTLTDPRVLDTSGNSLRFTDGITPLVVIDTVLTSPAPLTIINNPSDYITSIGTVDSNANITSESIDLAYSVTAIAGSSSAFLFGGNNSFFGVTLLGVNSLFLDNDNSIYTIGDVNDIVNSTKVVIDDISRTIKLQGAIATPKVTTDSAGTDSIIPNGSVGLYYDPSVVVPIATITLPSAPVDGQEVLILFGGTINGPMQPIVTSLTIAPSGGQSIIGSTPNAATTDTYLAFKYRTALSTWYRID